MVRSPDRAGFDRGEDFAGPAVEIQKAIVGERARDGHGGHAAEAPKLFAVEIVADREAGADGDDFGALVVFPDVGGRPAGLAIGAWNVDRAIGAPDLLAGILVESGDELLLLVVVDDDDEVLTRAGEEAVPKSRIVGKFSSGVFQTLLPSKS